MGIINRPRILRTNTSIRALVQETNLSVNDFVAPLFIVEGEGVEEEICSLPGYYRRSLDKTITEVKNLVELGIKSVLLFVKCPDNLKDNAGTEACNPSGLMQTSIKAIKQAFPSLLVMSDVALDPYSEYGHDGIVENQEIVNDKTVNVLAKMALTHAQAGADFVAPSDMMDGRILAMRKILEEHGLHKTGILSYSAKYASALYGPFRDALDSAPGFGDKKTYQMNPANRLEAIKETELDINEGADMVMVKPASFYLDIIREIKNTVNVPVVAYQVSGEYAMIKAAAQNNWLNEKQVMVESLLSIKRAGADIIITYFAKEMAQLLKK